MNDDELGDEDWDKNMIEFQSKADAIKKRIEENVAKLGEISDKVSEVLGVILIDEIEEYLKEQAENKNDGGTDE
jgi:hypothetical protein